MLPLLMESYLIPSVAHIELFAASSGSSIRNVFGTKILRSGLFCSDDSLPLGLFGSSKSPSLGCFPNDELGLEIDDFWLTVGDGGVNQGRLHGPGRQ